MNFDQALQLEATRLFRVTEMPARDCPPDRVCIGPTAVNFAAAPGYTEARVPPIESELFKAWKNDDLARFYSGNV